MKHYTIPVFIPQLACPFQCIFCNQKKITDMIKIPSTEEIENTFRQHLSTIDSSSSHVEIGYFGGNFTGIELKEQKDLLSVGKKYIDAGLVSSIRISTRPDYINKENLCLLKEYGVGTIELGAQSMCNDVLIASGRGHKAEDTIKASEMIRSKGFALGLQMMVGLPGDTDAKSVYTAEQIISLGAECTRIYPALVIKDTKMQEMYNEGIYKPLSMEDAVRRTKLVYRLFEDKNVNIIRVGLHPSEGLIKGNGLVAGPFHISFRELVLSDIWKDQLMEISAAEGKNERLIIYTSPGQINYSIGYKAGNKKYLLQKFRQVDFKTDAKLNGREFYADIC